MAAKGRVSGASRVLRWVPDSLPLRFAPLQASGKARLRVWAQLSRLLSRAHAAKAECDPGPSARRCREAAPNSFHRGLLRHEPYPGSALFRKRSEAGWGMILGRLAAVPAGGGRGPRNAPPPPARPEPPP